MLQTILPIMKEHLCKWDFIHNSLCLFVNHVKHQTNHEFCHSFYKNDSVLVCVDVTMNVSIRVISENTQRNQLKYKQVVNGVNTLSFNHLQINVITLTYLLTSHRITSATKGKFGFLKFSMEISLGYPKALIISVKSDGKSKQHRNLLKLSKTCPHL